MTFARIINCQKYTNPELGSALLHKQDWTMLNGFLSGNLEGGKSMGRNSEIREINIYSINLPTC